MQYEDIRELIEIFEKTDLNDMELCMDNVQLRLNRGAVSPWTQPLSQVNVQPVPAVGMPAAVPTAAVNPPSETKEETAVEKEAVSDTPDTDEKVIKAPIVGTFYQSSAPDNPPYVKAGDIVAEGDVVCIIEAMKFMNEVTSEESGVIAEVLVKDGQFVEYGQPLFRLKSN